MTFGSCRLPNMSEVSIQDSRIIQKRVIPKATVRHRSGEPAGGRVIQVTGEIRNDPDYVLRIEELRVRADDIARDLDLEKGSATINAKLRTVEVTWTAERGADRAAYRAVLHETS